MIPGTLVRMSKKLKRNMRTNGCEAHIREFGKCFGVVIGPVDWGTELGPEVDVRWQPSNLRYMYDAKDLIKCNKKIRGKRNKQRIKLILRKK